MWKGTKQTLPKVQIRRIERQEHVLGKGVPLLLFEGLGSEAYQVSGLPSSLPTGPGYLLA